MQFLLYLFTFTVASSYAATFNSSTKFNITIKTPKNRSFSSQIPYKSVHIKYTLPNSDDRWNIVKIEPFIRNSNGTIQKITVHLCQISARQDSIQYDDETICNGVQSMLIYQWTTYSSLSTFRMFNDLGIQLDESKSVVLSVTYSEQQQLHKDRAGVILYISTVIPRFHIATLIVGNKKQKTRFSCRLSNYPRLLKAVQPLFSNNANERWSVYSVRNRNFGRKLIQPVLNSSVFLNRNKTDIEHVPSDLFLIAGDYIIIECEQDSKSNCHFLIYYMYKNIQSKSPVENDYICQDNNYPDLFKLIPETKKTVAPKQDMAGSKIFIIILVVLFVTWISIIIGCIIMRRVRGLFNFRSEPLSSSSAHGKGQATNQEGRGGHDQRVAAEADYTAQLDIEHMGLMS